MDVIIRNYQDSDRKVLIHCLEALQDHLVAIDPRKRLRRQPEYGEKYTENLLDKIKKSGGWIGLAECRKKIVGCIAVILEHKDEIGKMECVPSSTGDVLELYVDYQFRNKGIGAKLMDAAEKHLRSKGCDAINLEVFVPNKRAHEFYKKCGYEDRSVWLFKLL